MRQCGTNVHSRSGNRTRPGADFTLSGPLDSLHDAFRYCAVSPGANYILGSLGTFWSDR